MAGAAGIAIASSAYRPLSSYLASIAYFANRKAFGLSPSFHRLSCRFWSSFSFTAESAESGKHRPYFKRISSYGYGDPLISRLPQRSPFKGSLCVSYHSPDGTPFYYPGDGFAELGIHPLKLLQPGDPDTFQVKIRDVMPVGYFVDMPSGREGYLPANDLGFSGGVERLRTIFQVGQEVTVRITFRGGGGRELLSIRKYDPERPPIEPPKVARSSGSGKHKISSMMRRRAQQQRNNSNA